VKWIKLNRVSVSVSLVKEGVSSQDVRGVERQLKAPFSRLSLPSNELSAIRVPG